MDLHCNSLTRPVDVLFCLRKWDRVFTLCEVGAEDPPHTVSCQVCSERMRGPQQLEQAKEKCRSTLSIKKHSTTSTWYSIDTVNPGQTSKDVGCSSVSNFCPDDLHLLVPIKTPH
jgi:hypothetical protein